MLSAHDNTAPTTRKSFSKWLVFNSLFFGLLASSQAMAVTGLNEYFCADDIANVGNCTANEVSLSGVTNIQVTDVDGNPLASCYDGQLVKIANLEAQLDNNTGQRWDITFWVGRYGNDPRTPAGDDPTACTVTTLPHDGTGAPYISDNDGDDCWDFSIPPAPVDLQFGGGDATFECRDSNDDGIADLIVLTTWQQNTNFVCGAGDSVPPYDINDPVFMGGSPSKCDITVLDTVPLVAAASLTVTKVSQGGTNNFGFTGSGFPTGTTFDGIFQLDTTAPTPGTASLTDPAIVLTDGVNGDTFTITEAVPNGWSLVNATCSNGDDPTTGVTLVSGDDVTCTFTDVLEGSVTIVKNTVGGDATFGFTSGTPPIPASFNIMTTGGTGSASTIGLTPGTYSVTETPLANWDLTDLSCVDPDGGSTVDIDTGTVTIDLDAGETITCTYENTQRAAFTLFKTTTPSSSDVFSFTHDIVGTTVPASPVNVTAGGVGVSFLGVVPGSYTVTETDPTPAYDLNDIVCQDGSNNVVDTTWDIPSRTVTLNIDPGEVVSCQYLNVARGNLTVVKDLSADGPASKTFDITSTALGDFQLTPADSANPASTTFTDLVEGLYDLAEADPTASGWQLVSATCTDGTDLLDPEAANPGFVYVDPGEDVTCTFVNSPLGSSTIVKTTVGGDDTFTFSGTAQNGVTNPMDGLSLTTVDGTDFQDFSYQLDPNGNPFTVTEDTVNPPGWALTNIECTEDGTQDTTVDIPNATASINVDLAEAVTCTFTNTADATLVVQKSTVPSGLADAFTFTSDGAVNWDTSGATTAALADGQSDSQTGQPGVYSATETVLPGFAITNITCSGETLSTIQIGDGTPAFEDGDDYVDVDLAAGETVTCVFENTALGSIQIVKNTEGGDGSFLFSGDLGGFQLDTSGNTANTTFSDLLPGDYMIGEIVPVGWDLTDLSCVGETNTTYNYTNPSVTVSLTDGEDIVCTFTNAERGSITVAKATDPTGSAQSFDFTGDITATLTDGQLSTPVSVAAGTYSVTESAVAGWDVTDISCTDANSSGSGSTATFNVESGEDVICYFTNTIQRGQIIVDKQTAPAESPQLFDFTLTGTGVNQGFQLADTSTPYNSGDLLPTSENGTYNLAEGALPEGWSLVSATCSDESDPAAINLSPGEIVTCTFVNAEAGQSTFTKVSIGGDDTFNFTNTGPSGNFSLTTVGGVSPVVSLSGLEPGQYVITEEALAGWVLTNIVCTESGDQDSVIDIPNRTVTLNVQDGETINCTVTNTKNGSITVAKTTVPSGLPTQFAFTGDVAGSIGDGGTITVPNLQPGTYSSVEDVTAGWDLTSIACDDGVSTTPSTGDTATRTATFNLDPGENVICTFTNTVQYGTIIVDKTTLPAASPQSFDFTLAGGQGTNVAFALTDTSPPFNSGDLIPTSLSATYSVVETPVAGWENTSVVCNGSGGAEDPAAISLDPDETVTCTFANTQNSSLTIVKTAVGGDGSFDFTSVALGNFNLTTVDGTAQVNYPDLEPGVFDVAETGMPTAWTPVPAVCSDGSSADAIGVDPGESVTCEFVNLAPGDIIITVETVGLPDQEFCFDVYNRDTNAFIGQFCITTVDGIAQVSANTLPVGPYRIQEIPNPTYTLEEFTCDNGAQNDSLVLDPGDVITCPFRVVPIIAPPDVAVPASSGWALVLLTLMLLASGWYFRPAVMRRF